MRCAKAKCVVLGGHVCGRVVVVILAQSTVGAEAGGNERTKGVGGGGVALFLCWGVGHDGWFCSESGVGMCRAGGYLLTRPEELEDLMYARSTPMRDRVLELVLKGRTGAFEGLISMFRLMQT